MFNTSALDLLTAANVSGVSNFGSNLSGFFLAGDSADRIFNVGVANDGSFNIGSANLEVGAADVETAVIG
ncbi:hypothetical protein OSH93_11320, partial [Mycobacterium ulcerans]